MATGTEVTPGPYLDLSIVAALVAGLICGRGPQEFGPVARPPLALMKSLMVEPPRRRLAQDCADQVNELLPVALFQEQTGQAMDADGAQGLVGVDITDASHHAAVHEEGLDRLLFLPGQGQEIFAMGAKRLGPVFPKNPLSLLVDCSGVSSRHRQSACCR